MKPLEVYLSGMISVDVPESLRWRLAVSTELTDAGFIVRSPIRNKGNIWNVLQGAKEQFIIDGSKSIVLRDRNDVKGVDIIFVHLETFNSDKRLLGTIAELAWAWDQHTPVIGVAYPENALIRGHPFIKEFVSVLFPTVEEAVGFVKRYYAPINIK